MRKLSATFALVLVSLVPAVIGVPGPDVDARACNGLRHFPAVEPADVAAWLVRQYDEPAGIAADHVAVALEAGCR